MSLVKATSATPHYTHDGRKTLTTGGNSLKQTALTTQAPITVGCTKAIVAILILVVCQAGCREGGRKPIVDNHSPAPVSGSATAYDAVNSPSYKDTTIIVADTAIVDGERYIALYKTNDTLYVVNAKADTVVRAADLNASFDFEDFNGDGYKDLLVHYLGNVPAEDLLLFSRAAKTFRLVEAFPMFPEPLPVKGTPYYYSYHRSGCSDMDWDSDLFYLHNFKAVRIGNIAGRECNNRDEKDGIYIYTVKAGKKRLLKTLPIDVIWKHNEIKWGFIERYWQENYRLFR